ncbi:MAG: hypothetical protein GY845_27240, partial [Planctomycetes bacterium]|nr:hypothetical protein [Planctomycetota bacterium]
MGLRLKGKQSENIPVSDDLDTSCEEEITGLSQLYCPEQDEPTNIRDVLDVLLEMGKVTDNQFKKAREAHKKRADCDICQIITNLKIAKKDEIATAQASLHGIEFKQVDVEKVDKEAFSKLDIEYIKSNRIMPIEVHGKKLIVVTS